MSESRSGYEDVDQIEDADGVIAVISRRRSNGNLSVAVFKVFDRDGVQERTSFLQRRHLDAAHRVLDIAAQRMDALEDRRRAQERTVGVEGKVNGR